MGVQVEWDDDQQTTLRYTVLGRWTWDEFYAARDQARQMADAAAHQRLDSIIDIRASSVFPSDTLSHLRRMPNGSHPKLKDGTVVLIENNLFVRSLMSIMRNLSPGAMQHFYRARTLAEGRTLLLSHIPTFMNTPFSS